uniref:Uncharacterized protein n=1 Tax=Anguilla anguilla TaxID=7936 RepID=A0A0E9XFM6_ANGAN
MLPIQCLFSNTVLQHFHALVIQWFTILNHHNCTEFGQECNSFSWAEIHPPLPIETAGTLKSVLSCIYFSSYLSEKWISLLRGPPEHYTDPVQFLER